MSFYILYNGSSSNKGLFDSLQNNNNTVRFTTSIKNLEQNVPYTVDRVDRTTTPHGETIKLTFLDAFGNAVSVFLGQEYNCLTNGDLQEINSKKIPLVFTFNGIGPNNKFLYNLSTPSAQPPPTYHKNFKVEILFRSH